jgi:hypothetical protein
VCADALDESRAAFGERLACVSFAHSARAQPELLLGTNTKLENDFGIERVHSAKK